MKPLELSQARARWQRGDAEWTITDVEDNELWRLSAYLKEKDVMSAIRMGREFELKAFNIGINFGKDQMQAVVSQKDKQIKDLEAMNARLNEQLTRHIQGEQDGNSATH